VKRDWPGYQSEQGSACSVGTLECLEIDGDAIIGQTWEIQSRPKTEGDMEGKLEVVKGNGLARYSFNDESTKALSEG
jgi:hypothetical protein